MAVIGLQTSKRSNYFRIVYLISLFPILLFLTLWLYFTLFTQKGMEYCNVDGDCVKYYYDCEDSSCHAVFSDGYTSEDADKVFSVQIASETEYYVSGKTPLKIAFETLLYSLPILVLWLLIGINCQKQIIFSFTGAKELTRERCPEVYNIVENLAISRGLPVPKIGIIEDDSMNAFATGWSPKNSWIVFSRGLLSKLTKSEIEAVAGHEMTHIIGRDVKVMVIANVFIGMIGTIGYILLRTGTSNSSGNGKGGNPLPLLGLMLYLLSILILPFINLAISRKKEYLADAGSVELTKNRDAMINALKKISTDSRIEAIDKNSSTISGMFISNPKKKSFAFTELLSTHPTIEKRIEMLEMY